MGRRLAFHFVISRISIVVANSLVAPAIVGAGAVGWYGATREVGQEVPTNSEQFIVRDKQSDNVTTD
jgi:hypothetical protein